VLTLACIWYYTVQDIVHSEPLLACVVAGIWVTNRIDLAEEADKEGGTAAAAADIEKTAPSAPKELGGEAPAPLPRRGGRSRKLTGWSAVSAAASVAVVGQARSPCALGATSTRAPGQEPVLRAPSPALLHRR